MRWPISLLAAVALGVGGCSGAGDPDAATRGPEGSSTSTTAPPAACSAVESLVEQRTGHVLPGVAVEYEHHPPTSGLHAGRLAAGAYDEPIEEPRQVAGLEAGLVIVQYSLPIDPDDAERLAGLVETSAAAGEPGVVVAPAGPMDERAAVALTAWGKRQFCSTVAMDDIAAFIDRFAGSGPGGHA